MLSGAAGTVSVDVAAIEARTRCLSAPGGCLGGAVCASEAAVVGKQDAEWGEVVIAFLVADGAPVPDDELDALCLEHIARFKRPKQYRWVPALPKNSYGKVLKTELRAWL